MSFVRGHGGANLPGQSAASSSSSSSRELQSNPDLSSTWFIAAIVALIVLFYLICVYQCIIIYCRKLFGRDTASTEPAEGVGPTVLVHEGRVFDLTEDQRRAVLEVIYADNSKPATDLDVTPKKKKRRRKVFKQHSKSEEESDTDDDDKVPVNVEIPGIEANGSLITQLAREDHDALDCDPEEGGGSFESNFEDVDSDYTDGDEGHIEREFIRSRSPDADSPNHSEPSTPRQGNVHANTADSLGEENEVHGNNSSEELSSPADAQAMPELALTQSNHSSNNRALDIPAPERCESTDSWDNNTDENTASNASPTFLLPSLNARRVRLGYFAPETGSNRTNNEEKREEGDETEVDSELPDPNSTIEAADDAALHMTIPLSRRESYTTQTSEYTYDDDSCTTGDNVCPICLCAYAIGDVLILSKHCSHVFHKECILEWLQKHEDCPVCRTSMITETEINRAATTVVGKTRMYRAVASLRSQNRQRPLSPPQRSPNSRPDSSPLSGTIRRSASNFS